MTAPVTNLPIVGLTKLIGWGDAAGSGFRTSLRRSQIRGLTVEEWTAPIFVEGQYVGNTDPRYAVMALGGNGLKARIGDFATRDEANTYLTNDSLNLLS